MAQNNAINNRSSTLTVDNTLTVTAGDATVSAGNIKLPTTTSTAGQVQINAAPFLHNYSAGADFAGSNTFVGKNAGNQTLNGIGYNTGIGYASLTATTSGNANTAVGYNTLVAATTTVGNTAVGHAALQAATTGTGANTAVGYTTLSGITTGQRNTAIGMQALVQTTTSSSYNTALGYQAGVNYTGTESSNILIMNTGTVGESNKMRLGTDGTGNGQVDTAVIAGTNVSISTAATAGTVNIATGAAAKTVTLGSTNTTSSLALKYGTSDFSLASATGNVIVALDTGEVTMPLQSAFSAYLGTAATDVTGDGTTFTLGSGTALTEVFDQNGDFNTNGTFTAPVTGRYQLQAFYLGQQITTAMTPGIMITTSNRGYTWGGNASAFTGNNFYTASVLADMDAGDTAVVNINIGGGAKVVDIYGGAGDYRTGFSGFLAC